MADTLSPAFEAVQEDTRPGVMEELEALRQREHQWKEERELLLQRDRWWAEQWQQRETFWNHTFQVRELQWSYAQSENYNRWIERKMCHEQQVKDFERAAEEAEAREQLLLKLLQEEKHHLVIEIQTIVSETQREDTVEPTHCELSRPAAGDNVKVTFGDFSEDVIDFLNDPAIAVVQTLPQKVTAVKKAQDTEKPPRRLQATMSDGNVAVVHPSPKPADKTSESHKEVPVELDVVPEAEEASSPESKQTSSEAETAETEPPVNHRATVVMTTGAERPLDNVDKLPLEETFVSLGKVHNHDLPSSQSPKKNRKGRKRRLKPH